jgi:hypothetical protein
MDQLGNGGGSRVNQSTVLPCLPLHGHGSQVRSESGAVSCQESVQGVGGGLLQRPENTLEATRIKMITAVRRYLFEPSMKHVDFYAGGVPEYRGELLKFAAFVKQHGEPKWFDRPESR